MKRIFIDPGHGGKDRANRGPTGYIEADGVLKIAKYLRDELLSTGKFEVKLSREDDNTLGLRERGNMAAAWKADMFISEHTNAGPATAGGVEVYYSVDLPKTKEFAQKLSAAVAKELGITDRGAKTRESTTYKGEDYYGVIDAAQDGGVPAVFIIEDAFHTNPKEEAMLKDDAVLKRIAKAQAKVICEHYGVQYPPAITTEHLYRVRKSWDDPKSQIGAFKSLDNAKALADSNQGYKVFNEIEKQVYPEIQKAPPATEHLYRVRLSWEDPKSQVGAFKDLNNAKAECDKRPGYSVFDENGNKIYTSQQPVHAPEPSKQEEPRPEPAPTPPEPASQPAPAPQPTPEPPKQEAPQGTAILAVPRATVGQAKAWARQKGATDVFIDLADIYWRIAPTAGVDPVVAYCQSAKETGFGKFGGVLDESYKNPCGMKKKEGGGDYDKEAHQRFSSWEEGIQAHIDHLALYAGAEGYPKQDTPDPRHFPYLKGIAPTVEALGGKWAPSATYGTDIVRIMQELIATTEPVPEPTSAPEPIPQDIWAKVAAIIVAAIKAIIALFRGEEVK